MYIKIQHMLCKYMYINTSVFSPVKDKSVRDSVIVNNKYYLNQEEIQEKQNRHEENIKQHGNKRSEIHRTKPVENIQPTRTTLYELRVVGVRHKEAGSRD